MNKSWQWAAALTALIMSPNIAHSGTADKMTDHDSLVMAIRDNQLPSGYLDLSRCSLTKNMSEIPADRKTYRINFTDNFTYNPDDGALSTVIDTLHQHIQNVSGSPVLTNRRATAIVTSRPQSQHITYQLVIVDSEQVMSQHYQCPWDKAVFLWKPDTTR